MTRKRRTLIRNRPAPSATPVGPTDSASEPPPVDDVVPQPVEIPAEVDTPTDKVPLPTKAPAPEPPTPAPLEPEEPPAAVVRDPTPAHQAFPSLPSLTPLPEPLAAGLSKPSPKTEAPAPVGLDVPVVDAPYANEVTATDDFSRMELDAPPTDEAPVSIARAVHGAHYDAAYTVPQVPENLRRFDAVPSSDDFAVKVETAARAPDPPDATPAPSLDQSLPDVRFDPSRGKPPPASTSPWFVVGGLVLFGLGVAAVMLTVLGPPDLGGTEVTEDVGLPPLEPTAPAAAPSTTPIPASEPWSPPRPRRSRAAPAPIEQPATNDTPASTPEPLPGPPAALPGTLKVRSNKRALVWVEDAPPDLTPLEVDLPPGIYTVRAMQPGQPDTLQTREVEVEAEQANVVDLRF